MKKLFAVLSIVMLVQLSNAQTFDSLPNAGGISGTDKTFDRQTGATTLKRASMEQIYGFVNHGGSSLNNTSGSLKIPSGFILIGDTSGDPSAIMALKSTTQGFLLPAMNASQMAAISSPATGLIIYNTSVGAFHFYNGSAWVLMGSGSVTPGSGINTNTGDINLGGTLTQNMHLFRPLSIDSFYFDCGDSTLFIPGPNAYLQGIGISDAAGAFSGLVDIGMFGGSSSTYMLAWPNSGAFALFIDTGSTQIFNDNISIGSNSGTQLSGPFRYNYGMPQTGQILTSDAVGNATWQFPAGGGSWGLHGNAGTSAGSYSGTSDSLPYVIGSNYNSILSSQNNAYGIFQTHNVSNSSYWAMMATDTAYNSKAHIGQYSSLQVTQIYQGNLLADTMSSIDLYPNWIRIGFQQASGGVKLFGHLLIQDGSQGDKKALISDANGNATWAANSGIYLPAIYDTAEDLYITADSANWTLNGDVVTVTGIFYTSGTFVANDVIIITLPINSAFPRRGLCAGMLDIDGSGVAPVIAGASNMA